MGDDIFLLPDVSDEILADLYRGCDIFVLPSAHEGKGIVLLEAMACEKPVIAAEVGVIPDMVRNGTTGMLFPAGDSRKLARQMAMLAVSPRLRKSMGRSGLSSCREIYDWNKIAVRVEKVYLKAIYG